MNAIVYTSKTGHTAEYEDERMLYLLKNDKNYVSENNITEFMEWFSKST